MENIIDEIDEAEFEKIMKQDKAVVDFFAEWCMPCLMMSPLMDDLARRTKDVKFAKVNIENNSELAKKFNVLSIPCVIFFKNGKEVCRSIGNVSQDVLEEKINVLK